MRVFVTGASGFVGSAIVKELINNGHQVLGLARSDQSAEQLITAGAEVHRGSLTDPDSLKSGAEAADGVIHTAFIHDFTDYAAHCETDRKVIEAFGDVLVGTNKPLIVTSGIGILPPGKLIVESDVPLAGKGVIPRVASEEAAETVLAKGVKVSVVRLPPSVHDQGDHGFIPTLIDIARQKGIAAYVGDGSNHWPAVHRPDAAQLYRLILENGATAPRYHAVGEQGIPMKEIAETIGKYLNLPVVSLPHEEAAAHFGWIGHFVQLDCPASSQLTREQLSWQPVGKGLIEDMVANYF